jgi:hypothetical protein
MTLEEEYYVEKIMDKKLFGQELKYLGKINCKLVKWKGFDYD